VSTENEVPNAPGKDRMTEDMAESLKKLARDGKVDCALARKFALENDIPLHTMKALLDTLGLKVGHCQLGCF